MNRKARLTVFDDLGLVGFLEPDGPLQGALPDPILIHLEDGRAVSVSADSLAAEPDGRYRLLVARADLEGLTAGEAAETEVIPIVAEEIEVGKRTVERGKVRVRKGVSTREETVEVPLVREEVEVERVPINRPLDGPVEARQEGDVWIIPIIEEVLVVEKRLMLKEELHIRRRRVEETATERVTLRTETATVERVGIDEETEAASMQT